MSENDYLAEKLPGIARGRLPRHIAIIMDGNGRWASRQGLPRMEGHRSGAKTLKKMVKECVRLGIEYLTVYSFSMENWKRPKEEVNFIMNLCVDYLTRELPEMMDDNVRLKHLGRLDRIPVHTQKQLAETLKKTEENTGLTFSLALNYSSRLELVDAMRIIGEKVSRQEISPDDISEDVVSEHLYTAGMPDPDLLIRTAGERRISNYLLWQIAYSEFYVDKICWPEFEAEHLYAAIRDYVGRDRKYGGLSEKM